MQGRETVIRLHIVVLTVGSSSHKEGINYTGTTVKQ